MVFTTDNNVSLKLHDEANLEAFKFRIGKGDEYGEYGTDGNFYRVHNQAGKVWATLEEVERTWRNDPPTQKQIDRLKSLGCKGKPQTKGEASKLIDQLTPACHYCGQPATGFGFFDEPACRQCGG